MAQLLLSSSLVTALSPSGSYLALLSPQKTTQNYDAVNQITTIRILLYHHRILQTSLIHRFKNTSSSQTVNDDTEYVPRLVFCSDNYLVLLHSPTIILIWDLSRGVVIHTLSAKKEHYFLDLASITMETAEKDNNSNLDNLFVLTSKEMENKLYIYHYNGATGQLLRKIKAGKVSQDDETTQCSPRMVIACRQNAESFSALLFVVRHLSGWRVIDGEGNKISHDKTTVSKSADLCVAAHDKFFATTDTTGKVLLVDALTGQPQTELQETVHCMANDNDTYRLKLRRLQFVTVNNVLHLLIDQTKLFSVETGQRLSHVRIVNDKVEEAAILSTLSSSIFTATNQPTSSLIVILREKDTFQILQQNIVDSHDSDRIKDVIEIINVKDDTSAGANKRIRSSNVSTILGPTQSGTTARTISEQEIQLEPTKKLKLTTEGKDMMNEEEKEDDGPTIAERLRQLQEAVDEGEESDDEGDDDNDNSDETDGDDGVDNKGIEDRSKGLKFSTKHATTESLTQILDQALNSGDDTLLELALGVHDSRMIQESVRVLNEDFLLKLLTALTTRLSLKPNRADALVLWFTAILETVGKSRQGNKAVRFSRHLQALQNLLLERTAVFSDLLKLEGRLSIMGA